MTVDGVCRDCWRYKDDDGTPPPQQRERPGPYGGMRLAKQAVLLIPALVIGYTLGGQWLWGYIGMLVAWWLVELVLDARRR